MQTRRQTALTPLAIVLPHPPLPRRTSSLLSANSSSSLSLAAADPHTPRSCHSPCLLSVYYPPNRNSSDSWTSSNADDSMEFEWLSEQVLLLSRTLDALPAHLVTPFHGPVPPSNLLDKIARGVSQAKGPVDWPHSIRATRVKLLELARSRAKEEAAALERGRCVIKEEVEVVEDGLRMDIDSGVTNYPYFHEGQEKHLSPDVRRPLYRQSSMDFIKPSLEDIKGNTTLTRLSKRLQRSDRLFSNSAYHPYTRPPAGQEQRRSSSPPAQTDVPSLISPSTPSSSTLNTISSLGFSSSNSNNHVSTPRIVRHSASSSMFSTSSVGIGMGGGPLTDPRLERIRYTDAGSPPAVPPKDYSVKRAAGCKRVPAYGAAVQEVKHQAKKKAASDAAAAAASVPISATYSAVGASVTAVGMGAGAGKGGGESQGATHTRNVSLGSCLSSDEEETARSKRAKKVKTKSGGGAGVNAGTNVAAAGRREDSVVPPSRSRSRSGGTKTGTDAMLSAPVEEALRPCEVTTKAKSYPKSSVVDRIRGKDEDNKGSGNHAQKGTAALDEQTTTTTKVKTKSRSRPLPMNLQRNPSMFGAELPLLPDTVGLVPVSTFKYTSPPGPGKAKTKVRSPVAVPVHDIAPCLTTKKKKNGTTPLPLPPPTLTTSPRTTASPLPVRSAILSPSVTSPRPFTLSPTPAPSPAHAQSPSSPPLDSPGSPSMQRVRTLRRVRRLVARRISFGSLVGEESKEEEDGRDVEKEKEKECLGSAFQLI